MKKNPYLALVNKENLFDESMREGLNFSKITDSDGPTFIEDETYKAYTELNEFMKENYGIALFLTSAGRTVERQRDILEEFVEKMGKEEAYKLVALPKTSEHHTGLALDVRPQIAHPEKKQKFVESTLKKLCIHEKIAYPKQPTKEQRAEMYATLHEHLSDFGFIVRYTKEKQEITGYKPEPWHIRFVGKDYAKKITDSGLCLEEYVGEMNSQLQ